MRSRSIGVLVGLCAALALAPGTAGQAPPEFQPAARQPDSLPAARKALEGKWMLVSLRMHTADGKSALIDATGTLTSSFNEMTVEFRMTPQGLKTLEGLGITSPNPVISTTGRVLVDTQQQQIAYTSEDFNQRALGFDKELAARRANPFALERIRYYVFGADGTLRLATRHDNGQEASVSVWKKLS